MCRQGIVLELIQVAYTITEPKAFKRETEALLLAAKKLNCNNLTLITTDKTEYIEINNQIIHHYSAIDWLLKQ